MTRPQARPGLTLPLIACLTLGLAPYFPLPHVLEKLVWIYDGRSLLAIDVLDVLMHGAPWAWLAWVLARRR